MVLLYAWRSSTCLEVEKMVKKSNGATIDSVDFTKKAESLVDEFYKSGGSDFRGFLSDRLGREFIDSVFSPQALMSLGYRVRSKE